MMDFKTKMYQNRFLLGLCPRPRWGSLQRSPRPPSWIWRPLRGRGGAGLGKRRERGKRGSGGREREGPQVTVEPGPPEPCYATDYGYVIVGWERHWKSFASWHIREHTIAWPAKYVRINTVQKTFQSHFTVLCLNVFRPLQHVNS